METFTVGHRPPLFFMHIPKTAGTSMRRFLAGQYAQGLVCPAEDWHGLLDLPRQAVEYALVQGHFYASAATLLGSRRRVTLVRRPLNRTLSAIRHLVRDPDFHPLHGEARGMSLVELLSDPRMKAAHSNAQTRYLSANIDPHELFGVLRNYLDRGVKLDPIEIEDQPNLARAKQELARFDYIGLAENLTDFLPSFCDDMGFHPPTLFPHVNDAPEGLSTLEKLSAHELELLTACNELDLELYAYAHELVEQRRANRSETDLDPRRALARLCAAGIYSPRSDTFEIDLSGPVPGSGWHGPEATPGGVFRWTGPLRRFTLEIPVDHQAHYRALIKFFTPDAVDVSGFAVKVNGAKVTPGLSLESGVYTLMIDVPRHLVCRDEGVCQLCIDVPSVRQPAAEGSPDVRRLGIGVNSVVMERLN